MRYGSIANGQDRSFVEIEYYEAKKLNIPIFAYIIDEAYPFPIENVDRGPNGLRLEEFKKDIQNDFTVEKFTSPDDLADKVIKDLMRDLPKKGYPINEKSKKLTEFSVSVKDVITFFKTLPKIYYGKEFSIVVQFDWFDRATKSECEALSLVYGATIKRKIIPKEKELIHTLGNELNVVYAQYGVAEKLIRYKTYTDATIKVRTTQGIMRTKTPIYKEKQNNPLFINFRTQTFISGYETSEELIIGLELLELR